MRFKGSKRRKSYQRESCNLPRYPGWSGTSLNACISGVKVTDKAPDSSVDAPSVGNVDLSEVQWPEGIKEIHLLLFDEVGEVVVLPVGMERLSFCALLLSCGPSYCTSWGPFNCSLVGANFPS
ncbi:unnamed protein product, partial [Ectocarpus sp. 4 AP-2014]